MTICKVGNKTGGYVKPHFSAFLWVFNLGGILYQLHHHNTSDGK